MNAHCVYIAHNYSTFINYVLGMHCILNIAEGESGNHGDCKWSKDQSSEFCHFENVMSVSGVACMYM